MRTEEEIEKFLTEQADENGEVSEELMAAFLRGEEITGDTKAAAAPDPAKEAEPEEKQEEKPDKANPGEKAEDHPEPVILAKDGKHTIPYSELESERERSRQAIAEAAELRAKLEAIEQAEKQIRDDDDSKTDEQVRAEALEQIEEEFPGFKKALESFIGPVQKKLDAVLAEKAKADEAQQEAEQLTALQKEFDAKVVELEPRYAEAKEDPKFWEWFDKQPAVVRLAETSGDPQAVADVVKMYHEAQASDKADDKKAEPKIDPKEALAKAKEKPVVRSLSDVPGGGNSPGDEDAAVADLASVDLMQKMMGWSPDKIEQYLSRII